MAFRFVEADEESINNNNNNLLHLYSAIYNTL